MFVDRKSDDARTNDTDVDIELHLAKDTSYTYSSDLDSFNFQNEVHDYVGFPIISLNIRSLVNKNNFAKFEGFLETLSVKPLVIALNETWMSKNNNLGPHQSLKGYQFVHNSRKHAVGGGVAFFVSNEIHFKTIESLSIMKEKIFESLFLEVDTGGRKIICGSVYRSPNYNHEDFNQIWPKSYQK